MGRRVALITGVTGQDGALLAELLLSKDYAVHGIKRRSSSFNTWRVDHLYVDPHEHDPHENRGPFRMHYGDMTDATNLIRIIQETQPDEIYNLAAQSHVQVSFETPEYTANADGLGTLRLLEAIRILKMESRVRFYQASSSEMYGDAPPPQDEHSSFRPRSPYAAAKVYAYWITVNYREAYGLHASNGILFNHEGPTRGETFVTRKITRAVAAIEAGQQETVYLETSTPSPGGARPGFRGRHRARRPTGQPDDYVPPRASHSIREFVERAFVAIGMKITWRGSGLDEQGLDEKGTRRVAIDPRYFRPTEVNSLLGNPAKARERLGWKHTIGFEELVREMVQFDRDLLAKTNSQ